MHGAACAHNLGVECQANPCLVIARCACVRAPTCALTKSAKSLSHCLSVSSSNADPVSPMTTGNVRHLPPPGGQKPGAWRYPNAVRHWSQSVVPRNLATVTDGG